MFCRSWSMILMCFVGVEAWDWCVFLWLFAAILGSSLNGQGAASPTNVSCGSTSTSRTQTPMSQGVDSMRGILSVSPPQVQPSNLEHLASLLGQQPPPPLNPPIPFSAMAPIDQVPVTGETSLNITFRHGEYFVPCVFERKWKPHTRQQHILCKAGCFPFVGMDYVNCTMLGTKREKRIWWFGNMFLWCRWYGEGLLFNLGTIFQRVYL